MDPIVCFFLLGLAAGILRTNLKFPEGFFEAVSIYLLISIGLKGGAVIAQSGVGDWVVPALGTLFLGCSIPLIAYFILSKVLSFSRADSAALAAHYGSVSIVTFAVVQSYLDQKGIPYEGFMSLLVVILEIPAIGIGLLLAKDPNSKVFSDHLVREVFLNKSIFLLLGGLFVGACLAPDKLKVLSPFFIDPFKGILALFLLEMGLVVSKRLGDLRRVGGRLILFAIAMPILAAIVGTFLARVLDLSVGGTVVLATLSASASYIAAPAAVRLAIPEANPTIYLTASLGITFPFNVFIGIPLYTAIIERLFL